MTIIDISLTTVVGLIVPWQAQCWRAQMLFKLSSISITLQVAQDAPRCLVKYLRCSFERSMELIRAEVVEYIVVIVVDLNLQMLFSLLPFIAELTCLKLN